MRAKRGPASGPLGADVAEDAGHEAVVAALRDARSALAELRASLER